MPPELTEEEIQQILSQGDDCANAVAARILSKKLQEKNFKLLQKLILPLSNEQIVALYEKVVKIQKAGGLSNEQIGGFKTPGGVFITLCKQEEPQLVNLRKLKKEVI